VKEIPLTRGMFAIVDDDDFERLSKFNWHYTNKGYAVRKHNEISNLAQVFMHRDILNCPKGKFVDHINRNKLDNRKENLRIADAKQNGANRDILSNNTSGYIGVSYCKRMRKWSASTRVNFKQKHLGYYDSKEDAAKAYNVAVLAVHGDFASLNDVDHEGFKLNVRKKTSVYKGVSKPKGRNKWSVHICNNGKIIGLGNFDNEHDAARMYNFWSVDLFGENAELNEINEEVNA
jgi:hypothetical protein